MNRALRIALLALCTLIFMRPSFGQVAITVGFAPPPLPVYELPPCPADGYLWTPGYWAWDPDFGYYWIPGTWVLVPQPGFFWTPPWWAWETGGYLFHPGYWGPQVGFYGGINYGFGYFGTGFVGGRWDGGRFRYNTAVLNVNTTIIHNTYIDRNVIVHNNVRVSYNGGEGGIRTRPTPEQERFDHLQHVPPIASQEQHIQAARGNPDFRASVNQGKPTVAATTRPGEFHSGAVPAREAGGEYHAPSNPHAYSIQPHQVTRPNTGNSQLDANYTRQQQDLVNRQNQEHQQLVQRQEVERQQAQQQHYNQAQQLQMSQRHQQQFQQMEQQHTQQMRELQTRQPPPSRPR